MFTTTTTMTTGEQAPGEQSLLLGLPPELVLAIYECLPLSDKLCWENVFMPVRSPVRMEHLLLFPDLVEELKKSQYPRVSCSLEFICQFRQLSRGWPPRGKGITLSLGRSGGTLVPLLREIREDDALACVTQINAPCWSESELDLLQAVSANSPHLGFGLYLHGYLEKCLDAHAALRKSVKQLSASASGIEALLRKYGSPAAFLHEYENLTSISLNFDANFAGLAEFGKVLGLVTGLEGTLFERDVYSPEFEQILQQCPQLSSFYPGFIGSSCLGVLQACHGKLIRQEKLDCWKKITMSCGIGVSELLLLEEFYEKCCQYGWCPALKIILDREAWVWLWANPEYCFRVRQQVSKMDYPKAELTNPAKFLKVFPNLTDWAIPRHDIASRNLPSGAVLLLGGDDNDSVTLRSTIPGKAVDDDGLTVVGKFRDLQWVADQLHLVTRLVLIVTDFDFHRTFAKFWGLPNLQSLVIHWCSQYGTCDNCLYAIKRAWGLEDVQVVPMLPVTSTECACSKRSVTPADPEVRD